MITLTTTNGEKLDMSAAWSGICNPGVAYKHLGDIMDTYRYAGAERSRSETLSDGPVRTHRKGWT